MAFDFPSPATLNQVYAPPGGPSYVFNGVGWKPNPPAVSGIRPVARFDLAAPAASGSLTFAIPSDINQFAIRGRYKQSATGAYLGLRFSLDGGVTYKSGASDYVYTQIVGLSTGVTGTSAQSAHCLIANAGGDANKMVRNVECYVAMGDAAQCTSVDAVATGYQAASAPSWIGFANIFGFIGRPTHAQFITTTGVALDTGTMLFIEGA